MPAIHQTKVVIGAVLVERSACAKICEGEAIYLATKGRQKEAGVAKHLMNAIRDRTKYPEHKPAAQRAVGAQI